MHLGFPLGSLPPGRAPAGAPRKLCPSRGEHTDIRLYIRVIRKSRREGKKKKNPEKEELPRPTKQSRQRPSPRADAIHRSQDAAQHPTAPSPARPRSGALPAQQSRGWYERLTLLMPTSDDSKAREVLQESKAKSASGAACPAGARRAPPPPRAARLGPRGRGRGGEPDGDRSLGTQKSGTATRAREKRKRENKSRGSAPRASPDFYLLVNEPALPQGTRQPQAPPSLARAPPSYRLGKGASSRLAESRASGNRIRSRFKDRELWSICFSAHLSPPAPNHLHS